MFDSKRISNLRNSISIAEHGVHTAMSDGEQRAAVNLLRTIATELDCLKPVDNPLFADALDPTTYPEDAPIPAAPGPDYATRKQLYAAIGTLNGTAMVDRNAVLALTDRVELIEKALAHGEAIFKERPQGDGPISYRDAINELYAIIKGAHPRIVRRLQRLELAIGSDSMSGTHIAATVEQAVQGRRIELYNQAYLAALPAVIRLGHSPEDVAHLADRIATQSLVVLK